MNSPINSVDDLAKQTAIKYGTLSGGSTEGFFKVGAKSINTKYYIVHYLKLSSHLMRGMINLSAISDVKCILGVQPNSKVYRSLRAKY